MLCYTVHTGLFVRQHLNIDQIRNYFHDDVLFLSLLFCSFYRTECVYSFESMWRLFWINWKLSLDANPMDSRRWFIRARRLSFAISVWNLDSAETTKKNKVGKKKKKKTAILFLTVHSTFSLWMSADTRMLNILSICHDLFFYSIHCSIIHSSFSMFTNFNSSRKKMLMSCRRNFVKKNKSFRKWRVFNHRATHKFIYTNSDIVDQWYLFTCNFAIGVDQSNKLAKSQSQQNLIFS